jgi:hypothetical protein
MNVLSPLSLVVALVVTAPALVQVYDDPTTDVTPVLFHFALAAVLSGIALAWLRSLVAHYSRGGGLSPARRVVETRPGDPTTRDQSTGA